MHSPRLTSTSRTSLYVARQTPTGLIIAGSSAALPTIPRSADCPNADVRGLPVLRRAGDHRAVPALSC
jgi:hypothetical protein